MEMPKCTDFNCGYNLKKEIIGSVEGISGAVRMEIIQNLDCLDSEIVRLSTDLSFTFYHNVLISFLLISS